MGYFQANIVEEKITICLGRGMFSFCSVILDNIIYYHKLYKKLPKKIDSSKSWSDYKDIEHECIDIRDHFFLESNQPFTYIGVSNFNFNHQYLPYKTFDFDSYNPFVKHYFNPSDTVREKIDELENKYDIDYEKTICIYYRGTDKSAETKIASQIEFLEKLTEIIDTYPNFNIVCLTDVSHFGHEVTELYGNKVTIISEISQSMGKWGKDDKKGRNYIHGLYMLACVFMLQKCHTIICGSGNVSLWLALLRGHGNNIHQNLHLKWV
uniref:Uncharacterized protein n=1 Tax=viral metagenome TaxID=1070528 RepID=A0A6C0LJB4_9ZZZZ|tara:strand:- start:4743 stop:5540 length:798 start_codon:yes stop_codon:yes gene_type:complete